MWTAGPQSSHYSLKDRMVSALPVSLKVSWACGWSCFPHRFFPGSLAPRSGAQAMLLGGGKAPCHDKLLMETCVSLSILYYHGHDCYLGCVTIIHALRPLVFLQHLPPLPLEVSLWGWGSASCQRSGRAVGIGTHWPV